MNHTNLNKFMTTLFCKKCDKDVETETRLTPNSVCNESHFICFAQNPNTTELWHARQALTAEAFTREDVLRKLTFKVKEFLQKMYCERTLSPNQQDYFDLIMKKQIVKY
jgi:hypothetical protein